MSETSERVTAVEATLRTEQSAAKNLFFGEILEENLFPYPQMCERDRELLGMMTDSIDDFLAPQHADLKKWDKEAHQPAASRLAVSSAAAREPLSRCNCAPTAAACVARWRCWTLRPSSP